MSPNTSAGGTSYCILLDHGYVETYGLEHHNLISNDIFCCIHVSSLM